MIRLGYSDELYEQVGAFNNFYSMCVPLLHFSFVSENFMIAEGKQRNALLMAGLTLLLSSVDYAFISCPL